MTSSVSNDPFVGRERELIELTRMLDRAVSSSTQFALLVGEPGIGKTRLVEELADLATDNKVIVAWGACLDGGGAPPHWPWIQVLESLDRQLDGGLTGLGSTSIEILSPLLPELGIAKTEQGDNPNSKDRSDEEFVIGRAIRELISRAALQNPLLLVIEDIHWSDDASLTSLNLLVNSIRDLPVIMVTTYRDTDVSRTQALSSILPSLTRAPHATRIPVLGLAPNDVGVLLDELTGETSLELRASDVATRTGGNPFFIREMAVAMDARKDKGTGMGISIPEGIREAIGRRLSDLTDETLEILRIGALVGRTFDATILSEILNQDSADKIAEECEGLIDLGILVESSDHLFSYTFTHSLFQETIATEISASRRIRYHARIAAALEQKHGLDNPAFLSEIASHYLETELLLGPDKAIEFTIAAGRHAFESMAFETAVQLVDRGIELARESEHSKLGDLLYLRALAIQGTSRTLLTNQYCWDAIETAFDHYVERGDKARAIDAALINVALGGVRGPHRVISQAMEMISETDPRRPWLSLRLGVTFDSDLGEHNEALAIYEQVAKAAEASGNTQLLTLSKAHLCQTAYASFDSEKSIRYGKESISLAHQNGDWKSAGRVIFFLGRTMTSSGQSQALFDILSEIDLSLLIPRYHADALEVQTHMHLIRGEWSASRKQRDRWNELVPNTETYPETWSLLLAYQGSNSDWLNDFKSETQLSSFWQTKLIYAAAAAVAFDMSGDHSLLEATRKGADLAAQHHGGLKTMIQHGLCLRALLAVGENDTDAARELIPQLAKFKYRFTSTMNVAIDRVQARLSAMLDDHDAAIPLFETALEFCEKAGYWPEYVRSCLDYGGLLKTTGDESRGAEVVAAGLVQAERFEMDLYADKLVDLKEHFEIIAADSSGAVVLPDGLSEREVEVLRLVAAGHSNQMIADELFLSRYTIVRHVSNIFGKIDASNRTEAATYANRHGLVDETTQE